jgi:hypothetical protein
MSVLKRGNNPQDFFLADLTSAGASPLLGPLPNALKGPPVDSRYQDPAGKSYKSQWAEVAWFMKPNGAKVEVVPSSNTPLFSVYRRQRLAVQDNNLNWSTNSPPYPAPVVWTAALQNAYCDVSCWQNGTNFYFNLPLDLTVPERRFGMSLTANSGGIPTEPDGSFPIYTTATGNVTADIVLNDVISMDVRVLAINQGTAQSEFKDLIQLSALPGYTWTNSIFGPSGSGVTVNGTSQKVYVFDTWSSVNDGLSNYSTWATPGTATSVPLQIQLLAIQVSFRVWDFKTEQARQLTVIQDL